MKWTNDVVSACCGSVAHEMGDMYVCSECKECCEVYDEEYEMEQLWDYMITHEIATKDELLLIIKTFGDTLDNLEKVLFCRTGYRDLQQAEEMQNDV